MGFQLRQTEFELRGVAAYSYEAGDIDLTDIFIERESGTRVMMGKVDGKINGAFAVLGSLADNNALASGIQRRLERFYHLGLCRSLAIIGRL